MEGKENEGRLMRLRWTLQKALLHAPRGATPSTIIESNNVKHIETSPVQSHDVSCISSE